MLGDKYTWRLAGTAPLNQHYIMGMSYGLSILLNAGVCHKHLAMLLLALHMNFEPTNIGILHIADVDKLMKNFVAKRSVLGLPVSFKQTQNERKVRPQSNNLIPSIELWQPTG